MVSNETTLSDSPALSEHRSDFHKVLIDQIPPPKDSHISGRKGINSLVFFQPVFLQSPVFFRQDVGSRPMPRFRRQG